MYLPWTSHDRLGDDTEIAQDYLDFLRALHTIPFDQALIYDRKLDLMVTNRIKQLEFYLKQKEK